MSSNEVFEKKAGVKYVSIQLTKLDNGGWSDRSVANPVWEQVLNVGQAVVVSSLDHPEADVRFCHGKTGKIIEPFVQKGVIGYQVTVLGCGMNENASGGTGFFIAEDKLTTITPLDQRVNLSMASDKDLADVKTLLLKNATAFGTTTPDFDRTIREIKEKRPFKHGWQGICGLKKENGEPQKKEVTAEKIFYFTENTKNWLELKFTPGNGGFDTKAFKKWWSETDGCDGRSWNENLELWHAFTEEKRTVYYGAIQHAMDVAAEALKVKNAEKAKAAEEVRAKRQADRAAGVGRGRRAAAVAADDANLSKRRRCK